MERSREVALHESTAFDPAAAAALSDAYRIAVSYLESTGEVLDVEAREIMARKVIVGAISGERNVVALANDAIRYARQFAKMRERLAA